MKINSVVLTLLALSLMLVGCESVIPVDASGRKYWDLGTPLSDDAGTLRLHEGLSFDQVSAALGDPKYRKVNQQTSPLEVEWTYVRRVQFGLALKNVVVRRDQMNIRGAQLYRETARLTFIGGELVEVNVVRRREDVESQSIMEQSLSR